jgi:hypothetical protein
MVIDGGARSLDQQELMTEALALLIEDVDTEDGEEAGSSIGLDFYEAILGAVARHYASQHSPRAAARYEELLQALLDELRANHRLQDTLESFGDHASES